MPEVIGRDPKHEVKCQNCGAKLRFRLDEVKAGEQRPHSPDRDHSSVITCPDCRKTIDVTLQVGATSYEQAAKQRRYEDHDL